MTYSLIIFTIVSFIIILSALIAIKVENIFYSLILAIIVFWGTAALFYILGSEYNAVIQAVVYGFAIPVILAVALMFTTFKQDKKQKQSDKKYFLFLTGSIFILAVIYLILTSMAVVPDGFNITETVITRGESIPVFSKGIYSKYFWGFELISLILTIVAAGLTIFKKYINKRGVRG